MEQIELFFTTIMGIFKTVRITDVIDILLISYLVYKGIKLIRETRAEQLLKGIILMALAYLIVTSLQLKAMSYIFQNLFQMGFIALIVLFQPELRRALEKVGRTKVTDFGVFGVENTDKKSSVWGRAIQSLCNGVAELSESKTGALIVIERITKLGEQIDTGVILNADISEQIIGNIFFVNTPLHDGATIIRDGKILAAACFLPKPQKESHIPSNLGSRHRAAIGISEISDAVTIIVSEETGTVSIAENGILTRNYTKQMLMDCLSEKLVSQKEDTDGAPKKLRLWGKKK